MAQTRKMRISITAKLVVITTFLMLAATLPIVLQSSSYLEKKSSEREGDINQEQAKAVADEVENLIQSLMEKSKVVGSLLYKNFASEAEKQAALDLAFRSDRDLISVEVLNMKEGKPTTVKRIVNEDYLKQYELKSEFIENLRNVKLFPYAISFAGDVEIRNSTIDGGAPLLTLGLPLVKDDNGTITEIVIADIRLDRIEKVFASIRNSTMYLVDREGRLLAHADDKLAVTGKKMLYIPIDQEALTKKASVGQLGFKDPDSGEKYVGGFAKIPFGATVISQVPESIILAPSRIVRSNAFYLTGIVISCALFFIVLFSATLTRPLEILLKTTKEVAKGNFEVRAHVDSGDEVGELAKAFDSMVDGLKERDKVKNLFNKFHGTGIANKLISGEMKLGGEQREATVFFSDIRDFTSFSEKVQPHEVVAMLNEYFKIMVGIIAKNNGVVDKFIGDAIMAVWGAPESFGNDAANAITAALEMRLALAELNTSRLQRNLPVLRIGMGLHTGILIAGTIGSDDRMEYTVIGDTVNMASRIEAATKAYGTDLLISETTFAAVKAYFSLEEAGSAVVKGKAEPIKLYKVTGYLDENGKSIPVETIYSSYKAEATDKIKVA